MFVCKAVSPRNGDTCLFAYHRRGQRATLANHCERSSLRLFTGGIASFNWREFTRHARKKFSRRENIFNCDAPFPWPRKWPRKWVARSAYPWRLGYCTNPRHQGCQVRPVFFPHGPEFESDSRARNGVPHHCIGTDLPFPNEKTQADGSALSRSPRCFDEQTA